VAQWWNSLTTDQQTNWPLEWSNYFGSTDGIPATARDAANRGNLQYSYAVLLDQYFDPANEGNSQLLGQLKAKLIGMSDLWTRIHNGNTVTGDYASSGDLLHKPGASGRGTLYLMVFSTDGDGTWAVSIGNPDTAQTIVLTVPGVGRGLNDWLFQDLGNNDATMSEVWGKGGNIDQTAGIIWAGYDAPSQIIDLHQIPPWPTTDKAIAGAPLLELFEKGLLATHVAGGQPPHITVIGHSYGTVVVGETTLNGNMLVADDIILIGCPGIPVDNAAALSSNSMTSSMKAGGTQVWASVTGWDFVHLVNVVHVLGNDPIGSGFGAKLFASDYSGDHGGYWQGAGLTNMALIVLGQYSSVTPFVAPALTPSAGPTAISPTST
jgi:hypothetical protein